MPQDFCDTTLDITQASALEMLLDWQSLGTDGGSDEQQTEAEDGGEGAPAGTLEARVVEVATLPGARPAFHPKAWRFESDAYGGTCELPEVARGCPAERRQQGGVGGRVGSAT